MLGEGVGGLLLLRLRRARPGRCVEEAHQRVGAGVLGEVGIVGEVERLDHLEREIARGQHLHLALHGLLVERSLLGSRP